MAYRLLRFGFAAVIPCAAAMVIVGTAAAEPSTDDRGFVDSTARCAAPDTAVSFGSTASSRLVICADSDGQLEYRGVRVRDGAKLVVPAERSGDGTFVAENDGVTYLVTSRSLVIAVGERVIRDEPMIEFGQPGAPKATPTPTTPLPPPLPAEVGG